MGRAGEVWWLSGGHYRARPFTAVFVDDFPRRAGRREAAAIGAVAIAPTALPRHLHSHCSRSMIPPCCDSCLAGELISTSAAGTGGVAWQSDEARRAERCIADRAMSPGYDGVVDEACRLPLLIPVLLTAGSACASRRRLRFHHIDNVMIATADGAERNEAEVTRSVAARWRSTLNRWHHEEDRRRRRGPCRRSILDEWRQLRDPDLGRCWTYRC